MKSERTASWKIKLNLVREYDALADAYDALHGEEQEAKIRSALESVRRRRSDLVLDVGCGTGLLFRHIEEQTGFLVGLDISRRLLEKALCKSRDSRKISLIRADADYLPFIDGAFDKVFAVTVLQNMPDVKTTLHEITRIGKSDALFIVTGLKKAFTEDRLLRLLDGAGLDALDGRADERILDFVVVCRKKINISDLMNPLSVI